jgi:mRNA-degrading endonuclease RelE of RelBE toxin-antitoxin system
MIFNELPEFKKVLEILPDERSPFSFRIDNLGVKTCIIKVKKIACKSLKGRDANSGLRLIYACFPDELIIIFVEIYHKKDNDMKDRARIINQFLKLMPNVLKLNSRKCRAAMLRVFFATGLYLEIHPLSLGFESGFTGFSGLQRTSLG